MKLAREGRMTEDQIERRVERMVDHLDALLLAGELSQRDYDSNMRDLDRWAEAQYAAARP